MRQVLITGATGFIGGRLAEVACSRGIPVVGLVRTWSHAARLARLPVRMAGGDVLEPDSLRGAMEGCDVVFHCALDNRAGGKAHHHSGVQGTANVLQAALEMGVGRVIHLSSTAVYSYRPEADAASEDAAYHYSGDVYCDGKIDAEKTALRYWCEHSLPVTVLRPTIVYGPFGNYTAHTAALIREGRMVLVNGGTGTCNCLYVDNLVEAMLLAAEHQGAVGEVFHISDARPVTWKQLIEAHARALGDSYLPLPEMTAREIAQARSQMGGLRIITTSVQQVLRLARDPQMRRALSSIPIVKRLVQMGRSVARSLSPASIRRLPRQTLSGTGAPVDLRDVAQRPSPPVFSQAEVNMFTAYENIVFSIEKARGLLGYDPKIDFAEGMRRTAAWIEWARL
jgi:nucleoside-diphosphate-sugar epimerase